MFRALALITALALLTGCRSSVNEPQNTMASRAVQVTIVDASATADPVVMSDRGFRVGWYYDLTPFDSLRIEFTATRLTPTAPHDHIIVKLGPTLYLTDSIAVMEQDFSWLVLRRDLAKPALSALVFFVPDSGSAIRLSRLSMIGWTTI